MSASSTQPNSSLKRRFSLLFAQHDHGLSRYFLREWWLLAILSTLLALILIFTGTLSRANNVIFGLLIQAQQRPANPDIIIIAIDNISLDKLGKWPWSRETHTQLLNKLADTQPKAIAFDVVFAEPDRNPQIDQQFGTAMRRYSHLYLPLIREGLIRENEVQRAILPVSPLAESATKLGHIQVEQDNDGMARSVFLREGNVEHWWNDIAWLMYETSPQYMANKTMPGTCLNGIFNRCKTNNEGSGITSWQRDHLIHIPFTGPTGHYATIPYISVLNGEVPAEFFRNKYVFIGATAYGMNDVYPTPVGSLAGVEIHANTLDALIAHKTIEEAPLILLLLYTLIPIWCVLGGFLFLSPRHSLILTLSLGVGSIAFSAVAILIGQLWLAPMSLLMVLVLLYPLWIWRRLEAVLSYFGEELFRLEKEPHILPEYKRITKSGDVLQRRIFAMQNAVARVRDLRHFIFDSVNHLPDATAVTDEFGKILMVNKVAIETFNSLGFIKITGTWLPGQLRNICVKQKTGHTNEVNFDWAWLVSSDAHRNHPEILEQGIEIEDALGRDFLIKSAPAMNAEGQLVGWICSLIDLSKIRNVEKQRDEMLRFLSHDMRSPQSSIIALLELQKNDATAIPVEKLYEELAKHASRTLSLTDNFVETTRAQSQVYHFEEINLADLLMDAVDEIWTLARAKSIEIIQSMGEDSYYIRADRGLLTRAILNLLSNAIKYSPANTKIYCRIYLEYLTATDGTITPWVRCDISDQGYGISPQDQSRLFQRFTRFAAESHPRIEGFGLGLAFVKTVIERHSGEISCVSELGQGTTFSLKFPWVE